jgi:hypothetical protein
MGVGTLAVLTLIAGSIRPARASTVGIDWEVPYREGQAGPFFRIVTGNGSDPFKDEIKEGWKDAKVLCTNQTENGQPLVTVTYEDGHIIDLITAPIEQSDPDPLSRKWQATLNYTNALFQALNAKHVEMTRAGKCTRDASENLVCRVSPAEMLTALNVRAEWNDCQRSHDAVDVFFELGGSASGPLTDAFRAQAQVNMAIDLAKIVHAAPVTDEDLGPTDVFAYLYQQEGKVGGETRGERVRRDVLEKLTTATALTDEARGYLVWYFMAMKVTEGLGTKPGAATDADEDFGVLPKAPLGKLFRTLAPTDQEAIKHYINDTRVVDSTSYETWAKRLAADGEPLPVEQLETITDTVDPWSVDGTTMMVVEARGNAPTLNTALGLSFKEGRVTFNRPKVGWWLLKKVLPAAKYSQRPAPVATTGRTVSVFGTVRGEPSVARLSEGSYRISVAVELAEGEQVPALGDTLTFATDSPEEGADPTPASVEGTYRVAAITGRTVTLTYTTADQNHPDLAVLKLRKDRRGTLAREEHLIPTKDVYVPAPVVETTTLPFDPYSVWDQETYGTPQLLDDEQR